MFSCISLDESVQHESHKIRLSLLATADLSGRSGGHNFYSLVNNKIRSYKFFMCFVYEWIIKKICRRKFIKRYGSFVSKKQGLVTI